MSFNYALPPPCITVSNVLTSTSIGDNLFSIDITYNNQQISNGTSQYTIHNVQSGFWFSNYQTGPLSWRIKEITAFDLDTNTATLVVEDVEYYNAGLTGTGSITSLKPPVGILGYIWSLDENGLPNLYRVDPTITSSTFFEYILQVQNRFVTRNYSTVFVGATGAIGPSVSVGQMITLDVTNQYQVATSASTLPIIGTVTSVGDGGSGSNINFTYRPNGKYLKNYQIYENWGSSSPVQILNGSVGTLFYLDGSGNLTQTNTNNVPVYIQTTVDGDGILLSDANSGGGSRVYGATGSTGYTCYSGSTGPTGYTGYTGVSGATVLSYDTTSREIYYGTKTFIIDHPIDPNCFLVHACLEGPEAGVYYRGRSEVPKDSSHVVVSVPNYVDKIAKDITIQVTGIYTDKGGVTTYNVSEFLENTFTVYGPSGGFYWTLFGSRHDLDVEPERCYKTVKGEGPYKFMV